MLHFCFRLEAFTEGWMLAWRLNMYFIFSWLKFVIWSCWIYPQRHKNAVHKVTNAIKLLHKRNISINLNFANIQSFNEFQIIKFVGCLRQDRWPGHQPYSAGTVSSSYPLNTHELQTSWSGGPHGTTKISIKRGKH